MAKLKLRVRGRAAEGYAREGAGVGGEGERGAAAGARATRKSGGEGGQG